MNWSHSHTVEGIDENILTFSVFLILQELLLSSLEVIQEGVVVLKAIFTGLSATIKKAFLPQN